MVAMVLQVADLGGGVHPACFRRYLRPDPEPTVIVIREKKVQVYVIYFDSPHHEPIMYDGRDVAVGVAGEHWCSHDKARVRVMRFDTVVYRTLDECRHAMELHMPWTTVHGQLIWKDGTPIA